MPSSGELRGMQKRQKRLFRVVVFEIFQGILAALDHQLVEGNSLFLSHMFQQLNQIIRHAECLVGILYFFDSEGQRNHLFTFFYYILFNIYWIPL